MSACKLLQLLIPPTEALSLDPLSPKPMAIAQMKLPGAAAEARSVSLPGDVKGP